MGANIYPEDVEATIYSQPEIAAVVHSFQLALLAVGELGDRIVLDVAQMDGCDQILGGLHHR